VRDSAGSLAGLSVQVIGTTEEESIAAPIDSFLSLADAADAEAKIIDMQESRVDAYQVEQRPTTKDGVTRWAQFSVSAVRDDDGQLRSILTHVDDTTVRKRVLYTLQRRDPENQALFTAISDMLFTLDRTGLFLTFKPAIGCEPVTEPGLIDGDVVPTVSSGTEVGPLMSDPCCRTSRGWCCRRRRPCWQACRR
jgi:PAS domain S-box-containing protein